MPMDYFPLKCPPPRRGPPPHMQEPPTLTSIADMASISRLALSAACWARARLLSSCLRNQMKSCASDPEHQNLLPRPVPPFSSAVT